jgi:hypothetical protein
MVTRLFRFFRFGIFMGIAATLLTLTAPAEAGAIECNGHCIAAGSCVLCQFTIFFPGFRCIDQGCHFCEELDCPDGAQAAAALPGRAMEVGPLAAAPTAQSSILLPATTTARSIKVLEVAQISARS